MHSSYFILGNVSYYSCEKSYAVSQVPNTNLVLLYTDRSNPNCLSKEWYLNRDPQKDILFSESFLNCRQDELA